MGSPIFGNSHIEPCSTASKLVPPSKTSALQLDAVSLKCICQCHEVLIERVKVLGFTGDRVWVVGGPTGTQRVLCTVMGDTSLSHNSNS